MNFEFLQGILCRNQAELVDVAVVQGHSVKVLGALAGDGAANLKVGVPKRIFPDGTALELPLGNNAGGDRNKVHRVAPVQGKLRS